MTTPVVLRRCRQGTQPGIDDRFGFIGILNGERLEVEVGELEQVWYDDKGKYFTPVVSKQAVLANIQTVSHKIRGYIHVRSGERVKDELDRDEAFLAVTNAMVLDADGEMLHRCEFISINRAHIVWLIPEETPEQSHPEPSP